MNDGFDYELLGVVNIQLNIEPIYTSIGLLKELKLDPTNKTQAISNTRRGHYFSSPFLSHI